MTEFVAGRDYDARAVTRELGAKRAQEGLFVGAERILVIVTPGVKGVEFPERAVLRWCGQVPKAVVEAKRRVLVFVGRDEERVQFVGEGRVTQSSSEAALRDVRFTFTPPLPRAAWLELMASQLPPSGPAPEAALAALSKDSSPEETWAALALFIERWHGKAPARVADVVAPLPLCRLLAAQAAIPELFQHNHLVWPDELVVEDGRMVFMWENQSVCLWATEPGGEDALVWYRNNEEGEPWLQESAPLSVFLVQAVLFEAIMHGRFGAHATALPSDQLQPLLARLAPLGSGPWNWGGARFFGRDGALLMTMEEGGAADVFLAARTPVDLSPFEDLVSDHWDRVAF
jgi:hypothetical protein